MIEWAAAIFNGIKKFQDDNDVVIFGKIVNNEIEEQFPLMQMKVKTTIRELMKLNLRNLFPFKSNKEIKEMIETRCRETIAEPEVIDIIKNMYDETQYEHLYEKMESFFYKMPLNLLEYNQLFT